MDKKIIYVWGAGRLAGKIIGRYISVNDIEGFVDNDSNKTEFMGKPVITPDILSQTVYDAILVINLYSDEIRKQCLALNIELDKVIFCYNNIMTEDMNKDYLFVASIVGEECADLIKNRYHMVRGTEITQGERCFSRLKYGGHKYLDTDFIRIKTLEMTIKEIRKRKIGETVRKLDNSEVL